MEKFKSAFMVPVGRGVGSRRVAVCAKNSRDNGVSAEEKAARMAELRQEIVQNPEKAQEVLRFMSMRDRLEYVDSKGNLTRTFYSAVALTVLVYGGFMYISYYFTVSFVQYLFRVIRVL
ncbi:hypothetical protein NDN08_007600 [Rhodosorus marinus]|uniref:Calcium uniporter protein n=1 Tax=Rhodosorus marinus TaxID=101924 RepID=A0AAV8UY06_9RHOD|nr:hypothetical protein NDN08_007600 [Rhodosorus marinus]